MREDRFTNLEKDIIRSVGRVLSSQEMSDLKNTIFSAVDQVERATQKAAESVEKAAQKANEKTGYPTQNYYHAAYDGRSYSNHPQRSYRASPVRYSRRKIKGASSSGLWLAFSILGIVFGSCWTLISLIVDWFFYGNLWSMGLGAALALTAGSIVSTVFAGKSVGRIGRYRKYLRALGSDPMYTVKEIAERSSYSEERVSSDLPKFLSSVSLPFAKMDEEETCLILDKDTYQQYLDLKENRRKLEAEEAAKKARLAADPNAAAVEEMKKNGMAYLQKIRLSNDALPEQNISEKLDRLENTCRKIFHYVELHPNKLPQIRKLMSYYLPMTLKLVETYEQLEKHQMTTASVEESKAEIHSALDNINLAFENLFDRLLENDRMDLSADISVLETMLAQEGLTNHTNNINSK